MFRAARCAFWLGLMLFDGGEEARGGGWIARAGRLIDGDARDCVERGYLLLPAALRHLGDGDAAEAYEIFGRAIDVAERFDEPDLRALGRLGRGQALIGMDEPERAVRLLDEAMVAVQASEVSTLVAGIVYCALIAQVIAEARQDAAETGAGLETTGDAGALESWLRDMTYAADALAEREGAVPPPSSPFEALPFPRALRIAAFSALVERTFKDVHAYFFGGFNERMRQVVRDVLDGLDGPVIAVAHSLGTVIAHDVLREAGSSALDVPLFVTAGSPLAVTEVQDLVERPLEVPRGVTASRNVCDARDLVALDHTVRPEYAPAERCTDFLVTNDSSHQHAIREYLRTVPVRQPILELFQKQ